MGVYQMTAGEIYETYAAQADPQELMNRGRTNLANHLMVEEGLDDKSAYYAADMILQHAEQLIERNQQANQ
jgi:hypothetical protein